jgi:hypothetical protein
MSIPRLLKTCVLILATGLSAAQCIELKSSPFDTSQGGLLGFLTLAARGGGVRYVAAGNGGTVFTSSDGLSWQTTTLDASVNFNNAVWTGSRWVLVGGSASQCAVFISSDGINWNAATTPTCTRQLMAVAGNVEGTRVVAVGVPNPTNPVALASVDGGVTWNFLTTVGTYQYSGIVFANNQFIAFNDPDFLARAQAYFSDGVTNFSATLSDPKTGAKENGFGAAITVGDRVIVGLTDNCCSPPVAMHSVSTTDNGTSPWTLNTTNIFGGNTTNLYPRAFAVDGTATTLVAVGDSCLVDRTTDIANLNWTGAQTAMTGCSGVNWSGLIHDGGKFVATGTDAGSIAHVAVSSTGNAGDWTIATISAGIAVNHVALRP